jgi:magnesium chelatase family protein
VREARVRVAAALARLGVLLDEHAVTVNLAPADLKKRGTGLDVAIAVALLGALDRLPAASLESVLVLGELSLDGSLRPVRGVLPQLEGARARGVRQAIVPLANAREAGLVRGMHVLVAATLEDVVLHFCGQQPLDRVTATELPPVAEQAGAADLTHVRGQATARRALEIAAAGGHNLLMMGPPGGGKTLLARLLPTVLPPMTFAEAIETTAIHSVAGLVDSELGVVRARPFRAPHHSVSDAGLVGGGEYPRPGEVSLAHHGVLFLDELAEFRRSALEALRQPLEDGVVCISRARARAWFPARPMLVAAVNPCACGYRGHGKRECRCSAKQAQRYLSKLSGPLLDRIDLHVQVPPVEPSALSSSELSESSKSVRARVLAARERARERCVKLALSSPVNAALTDAELDRVVSLDAESRQLLEHAVNHLGLSARAYARIRRVARSVADLEDCREVRGPHMAEAIQGRLVEKDLSG